MKFKMRILHFSPAGNAEKVANSIARDQQANSDRIPPAYPVENEKLLILGIEMKGSSVEKAVLDLCKDLNPSRVKNVAIYAIGSASFTAINEVKELVSSKGINFVGDVYECTLKGGLFKKGSVTDDDVKNITAWAGKIIDSLVE